MVIFFFSSRRRHTRLQGDWSSDVCSSDLSGLSRDGRPPAADQGTDAFAAAPGRRSEEHTSELQSPCNIVCRLLIEKKRGKFTIYYVAKKKKSNRQFASALIHHLHFKSPVL